MKQTFFITGTDTGVGKTVLTVLLAQFLRDRGISVGVFKPLCSGGRADAWALHAALGGAMTLDEINPWHFRAAIAPALAARRERKSVKLTTVLNYLRSGQKRFAVTLAEGAGGLLSPLGDGFDSRDVLAALRATPIVVAPNKLGVVNHVLLTWEALPGHLRSLTRLVLMSPRRPDPATGSNVALLAKLLPTKRIFLLPYLGKRFDPVKVVKNPRIRRLLRVLVDGR